MEAVPHTLLNYLLETSICLAVFYMFYLLVLRKQPFFAYNRAYILVSSLLALMLPLLEVPVWSVSYFELSEVKPDLSVQMSPGETMVQGSKSIQTLTISWQEVLGLGYLTGVLLMFSGFVWQIYRVAKIIWQAHRADSLRGYWLVHTNGHLPISSFFNYLLWDNHAVLGEADKQRIIAHEEVHIAQGHSYDVLYMSLIKILLWFNPFAYLYFKELIDVHEYAADAKVIRQADLKAYAKLLVNQFLNKKEFSLLNHFHQSQILKRLKMMELTKSEISRFRVLWALPVFVLMFLIFSCEEERGIQSDLISNSQQASNTIDIVIDENNKVFLRNQVGNYVILQLASDDNLKDKLVQEIQRIEKEGLSKKEISAIIKVDPKAEMGIVNDLQTILNSLQVHSIIYKDFAKDSLPLVTESRLNLVFTYSVSQSSPKVAIQTLSKYVSDKINLSQHVKQEGLKGKVHVQFMINPDGTISNVETLTVKGAGEEIHKEVKRILNNATVENHQETLPMKVIMMAMIGPQNLGNKEADSIIAIERNEFGLKLPMPR